LLEVNKFGGENEKNNSTFSTHSFTNVYTYAKPSIISGSAVKIEIFDDGKISPHKIIANFFFFQEKNGLWQGQWEHIYIAPDDQAKDVLLKIEKFSTAEGTIQNFQKFDGGCSFDIIAGQDFGNRKYQTVIKENGSMPEVIGSALWYSELLRKQIKIEWKSTDKLYFELPYNKVF